MKKMFSFILLFTLLRGFEYVNALECYECMGCVNVYNTTQKFECRSSELQCVTYHSISNGVHIVRRSCSRDSCTDIEIRLGIKYGGGCKECSDDLCNDAYLPNNPADGASDKEEDKGQGGKEDGKDNEGGGGEEEKEENGGGEEEIKENGGGEEEKEENGGGEEEIKENGGGEEEIKENGGGEEEKKEGWNPFGWWNNYWYGNKDRGEDKDDGEDKERMGFRSQVRPPI